MLELQGIKERLHYALLCIWWRESTDHSRRMHIANQRRQEGSNENG